MKAAIAATVQIRAAPKQANSTEAAAPSRSAPTNRVSTARPIRQLPSEARATATSSTKERRRR